MSKTLVKLKLEGTDQFTIDAKEVFLPKLKTLHINDVSFREKSGDSFARLISGCYSLEELFVFKVIWDSWESCLVSNPSLKRETICAGYDKAVDENPKSVSFDTPSLVYLEFTDTVAAKYPKANFESLVEASVGIRMTPDQVFEGRDLVNRYYGYVQSKVGNVADFLAGVSNVKTLYLSSEALEVLTFCCKAIPIFPNLIHLTIETHEDVEWESLPTLLQNCPNLETLVFDRLHYGATNQCMNKDYSFNDTNECFMTGNDWCVCKPWYGIPSWLTSSPVKILKILRFGEIYDDKKDVYKQLDLVKYFVETMPNLEEVVLYYETNFEEAVSDTLTEFQRLEKVASRKCKVQLVSDHGSYSITVYSSSSLTNGVGFFKDTFPV